MSVKIRRPYAALSSGTVSRATRGRDSAGYFDFFIPLALQFSQKGPFGWPNSIGKCWRVCRGLFIGGFVQALAAVSGDGTVSPGGAGWLPRETTQVALNRAPVSQGRKGIRYLSWCTAQGDDSVAVRVIFYDEPKSQSPRLKLLAINAKPEKELGAELRPRFSTVPIKSEDFGRGDDKSGYRRALYEKVGFSKKEAADLVELVFETIKAPFSWRKLRSRDLKFCRARKRSRVGRNPQTGESIGIMRGVY